ncbi:hypothetical protein [Caulobacter segnis]
MTTDITLKRGSRWTLLVWIGAALLLLTPAVAMRFTSEVVWTPFDFVVWGAILALACGTFELAVRASGSLAFRAAVAICVVTSFLIVWISGAVGIIGDEDNPANLMFGAAPLVVAVGAYVGRFRSAGLSRALLAAALIQAVVAIIAQLMGSREGFVISAVFTGAWLLAAWLFSRAARVEAA